MNIKLFEALLYHLQPETLARLVVDLEEAGADWAFCPEAAPAASEQNALVDLLTQIKKIGVAQAEAERVDFDELLDQVRAEAEQNDWLQQRNQQDRQNWFSDYR